MRCVQDRQSLGSGRALSVKFCVQLCCLYPLVRTAADAARDAGRLLSWADINKVSLQRGIKINGF